MNYDVYIFYHRRVSVAEEELATRLGRDTMSSQVKGPWNSEVCYPFDRDEATNSAKLLVLMSCVLYTVHAD